MKRVWLVCLMLSLAAGGLSSLAGAQGGPEPGPPGAGPPGPDGPPPGMGPPPGGPGPIGLRLPPPELLDRLGLSRSQRTKIDELLEAERRQAIKTDAEIRLAELDLQDEIESDPPDRDAIDHAMETLEARRAQMLRARVTTILGIRAVLSPEQRSRLRRPDGERWH
jgi:Spy/CpxP family protein refolding chaperone